MTRDRITLMLLMLSLGALARAQPDAGARACAEIEAVEARIECIEKLLARQDEGGDRAGTASSGPDSEGSLETASEPAGSSESPGEQTDAETEPRQAGIEDAGPEGRFALIVDVRSDVPGRAVFVTESGREFVQTTGGNRLILPEVPFEAELRDGLLGGFFLVPPDNRPAIRVSARE